VTWNERTVIGDVLDDAVDDLAFSQRQDEARTLLGAGLFEDRATRDDDVAALAVHLEDLERLRDIHQRGDIADGADVDLRARQEGHGTVEVDREAALDAAEDNTLDACRLGEFGFERVPSGFAACAVARQHRFTVDVLDAVDEHFDFVTDLEIGLLAGEREFAQRHAAFRLEADVDDGEVVLDPGDGALDDAAFETVGTAEGQFEKGGEIVAGWVWLSGHKVMRS
jgi:hypothetical protein